MFLTKYSGEEDFDWNEFFCSKNSNMEEILKTKSIIEASRKHLKDNPISFSRGISLLVQKLTEGLCPNNVSILELGAATGFLTRCLIRLFGGNGTLIDNSLAAYELYKKMSEPIKKYISYKLDDIFTYTSTEEYDIVCSFGVIEHFSDKANIMRVHREFMKDNGYCIIMVPMDTPLTRTYYELHPELNLGYRELVNEQELKNIIESSDLKVIRSEKSQYLNYDVLAVICSK